MTYPDLIIIDEAWSFGPLDWSRRPPAGWAEGGPVVPGEVLSVVDEPLVQQDCLAGGSALAERHAPDVSR